MSRFKARLTDRLDLMRSSSTLGHTRAKEANCVHRVSGASEWNIKISAGSSGVAVSLLIRREEGRDDVGKKIIIKFKHKYPSMELINISGSESVRLCEKNC